MKRHILIAVIALLSMTGTALTHAKSTVEKRFKVSSVEVSRVADDRLSVAFDIDPRDVEPGRDREVVFQPVIRSLSGSDSLELEPVTVCGHNSFWAHVRNHDVEAGRKIYRGGSRELIRYREEVKFEPWMQRSRVSVDEVSQNCCDPVEPVGNTPVADLDFVVEPFVPEFNYVTIVGDSAVELTAEGKAFIDFVVNRTEIKPDYRGNKKEIAKIIESIDKVKNDPDATITQITIKGFASPEGSYSNNVRLAMGRTASLKEYVRSHYNFDPTIMSTDYEPEDWEGLRRWLETCDLPHKAEILEIVNSPMEPDPKDHEIRRRYPAEYAVILRDVYPALRHSDYTVKYRIKTYVDIDELKRVFKSAPDRLRPVDFSRIAATYAPDSKEFEEVYLKAVEIYPANEEANLNAANIMMRRGDLRKASNYIAKAGDSPEALYTRGSIAARSGDLERSATLLQTAADQGCAIAASEMARLKKLQSKPSVTYLITPQK